MSHTALPSSSVPAPAAARKGHPPGLYILFLTEMWERMSFYGMRALLVLYMTDYLFLKGNAERVLGFSAIKGGIERFFGFVGIQQLASLDTQALASQVYGLYTGLVYLTPFFGGILADRLLGQRRTVMLGAVIMSVGHFLMASETLFFPALFCIIVGNGCFKPNITTQVGALYAEGDPRRDRAFNIFYVGINVGAFMSPYICGTLGQKLGWHWGFGAAGVGMLLGLGIFVWGQKYLAPEPARETRAKGGPRQPLTRNEKLGIWGLVALCLLNVVFWAVYEQQGNTLQLWAERQTEWPVLFGFQIPSTWYQSFNPAFIVLLTPLITAIWAWQSRRGKEPSSVVKMAIGCFLLGLAFIVMILAAQVVGDGRGSILWLAATTLVFTTGELFLSPVGLSLVTKVAPARMVSMMMGMWFLSSFLGNYLSGFIGSFYEKVPRETFFLLLTGLGVAAGAAMFAFAGPLRRAIGQHGESVSVPAPARSGTG